MYDPMSIAIRYGFYLFTHYIHVALSNATFTPCIIIPGVPTAGDNFNITCKLDGVVERLAVSPTVTLTFFNPPGGTPNNQSQNESAYILPHIFNPGMTAAGGTYECVATIISNLIFVESATEVLQIQSMLHYYCYIYVLV